ncbi:MAG TPA: PPC domain-containing protein [Longimicrobium sp.]|nr:PPC domain-containing protein [Longimicrobium sp.]
MKKRFLLPLAAVALTAGSAAAQRPIVPGEITRGALSNSDPRLANGTHYDDYVFAGRRNETVIVTLESASFDTYLYLGTMRRGTFTELQRDDDGGNGTNSRIQMRLPEDGTYVIRASSLSSRTGGYTLTLTGGRQASDLDGYEDDPVDPIYDAPGYEERNGGRIAAGARVRGRLWSSDPTLDNGAPFHLYSYDGRRGEQLTITLRSDDFDAYLVIGTRGGRHGIGSVLARDDDGGGGRDGHDARINVTLPGDGEVVIRVNPLMPEHGEYRLEVESSLGGRYSDRPPPSRPGDYDDRDDDDVEDEIDFRLIGRWGLTAPGVRVNQGDWSSVTANASMGILTIEEDGAYAWRKSGRLLRGQLVPFTPRRDARPGVSYYLINDGRDEFYLFFTEYRGQRYLQVNARGSNTVVAHGYREGGSY